MLNEHTVSNISSLDSIFNNNFIDYRVLSQTNDISKILNPFINDIKLQTPVNNNLENLIDFFPERLVHFENFELSNLELDEGVFEALSTPE
jgi:hypothetical protein